MKLSDFGALYAAGTGISQLMDDLTLPPEIASGMLMLGGGNPANIPAVETIFRQALQELAGDPDAVREFLYSYGSPGGEHAFKQALADLFNRRFGWSVSADNVALTNGSQNAFFLLFNLFAGQRDGRLQQILLPLVPEYIGYADVSVNAPFFCSRKPLIDILDDRTYKYHVDLGHLPIDDDIGAMCLSRPTNPTGNVPTDDELAQLRVIARERDIPLIIDNAYGAPFPNVIHTDAELCFDDHTVLTMSLSKVGLPALRTGIVIANERIITLLTRMNAVINLAPGSIGAAVTMQLVANDQLLSISNDLIRPYYKAKADHALAAFRHAMGDIPGYAHVPEGAFFLWLWFPELTCDSQVLYQRLKERGVLVVPGHHFFPGLEDEDWPHRHQCLRVSYARDNDQVERGMAIIADEVGKASRATSA